MSISIDGNKVSLSIGMPAWAVDQRFPNNNFDLKFSSINENAVSLKELGWDLQTFRKIIEAFRKTKCESAMTDEEVLSLGYKTGTWSSYGYHVSSKPIDDSTRKKYETYGIQVLNGRVTVTRGTAL